MDARRTLAVRYDELLKEIRGLNGFESFLRPKKLSELASSCASGPVVVVNVHPLRCDALILRQHGQIMHVPLPEFSYGFAKVSQEKWLSLLKASGVRERSLRVARQEQVDQIDPWNQTLEILWLRVIRPVLEALGYIVS